MSGLDGKLLDLLCSDRQKGAFFRLLHEFPGQPARFYAAKLRLLGWISYSAKVEELACKLAALGLVERHSVWIRGMRGGQRQPTIYLPTVGDAEYQWIYGDRNLGRKLAIAKQWRAA